MFQIGCNFKTKWFSHNLSFINANLLNYAKKLSIRASGLSELGNKVINCLSIRASASGLSELGSKVIKCLSIRTSASGLS